MSHSIKTSLILRLVLFISIPFFSCTKKSNPPNQSSFQTGPGVYVSGFTFENSEIATFWKDGAGFSLNADRAIAITSKGNDIYAAGIIAGTKPVYWKNDVMTNLPLPTDGMGGIGVSGIAVAGGDVYVVGNYFNSSVGNVSIYWKNGVLVTPKNFTISGMAASGNDIYMVGYLNGHYAYTKNDVPVNIDNFHPIGIAVAGTDVVIYGDIPDRNGSFTTSGYWKNGVITNMGANIELDALYVRDGNVYLAGFDNNPVGNSFYGGTYWKNGIPIRLNPNLASTTEGNVDDITAIYVDSNNNVFVAGQSYRKIIGGVAAYWKNGTRVDLTTQGSRALGIVVIE